jgi:hypothetical protein
MTIPANYIARVIPGVVTAGGSAMQMNGVFLTGSTRVPLSSNGYPTVQSFTSALDVSQFFGATSDEYEAAKIYFAGFLNCTKYPAAMYFAQYPGGATSAAVAAWLRSGNVSGLGLPAIKAITSGTLTVTIDGYAHTAAALDLSGATSFSSAAALIQSAINASNPSVASVTGAIASTTLTVTAVSSGTLSVGQTITGGTIPAGTIITALGTGTGLTGTYTVNQAVTQTSTTITALPTLPTVTYDSIRGAFVVTSGITGAASQAAYATGTLANTLLLSSSKGAMISQGAPAIAPGSFMDNLSQINQNWGTFTTIFDPDNSVGNTQKLAFCAWANSQANRFAYVCWDADVSPTTSNNATGSLGYLIGTSGNNYSGICLVWDSSYIGATFAMSFAASLDFQAYNGRATLAFKSQNGLVAKVTQQLIASNLTANGYNYYGAWATANQDFLFMYPGEISGPFLWFDSYINQIWLSNQLQLAIMNLFTQVKSIPYNVAGYTMIEAACMDPILQGVNFGAIRAGVTLSQGQISQVNSVAGKSIDQTLSQRGWYFLVQDAQPQVRAARQSPPCYLWYMDGQSVQALTINSLDVL